MSALPDKHVASWIEALRKGTFLNEADFRELCALAKARLIEMPTLRHVSTPVSVCGDVHGQFYDVLQLFAIGKVRCLPQFMSSRDAHTAR